MNRFADLVAANLLDGVSQPPIDVHAVAARCGVRVVEYASLHEDGRFSWEGNTPVVGLRRDRSLARKRFTLAHELAHWALSSHVSDGPSYRRMTLDPSAEERLCDAIAGALLMPSPWVQRWADDPLSLDRLREMATKAGVSLSAAAVRLAETRGEVSMLLRWRTVGGLWILAGMAGVPRHMGRPIAMTSQAQRAVDKLADEDTWLALKLGFGATAHQVKAHVSRGDTVSLMLVTKVYGLRPERRMLHEYPANAST
ncbi:MAG TPA: ImmA/IrrE family metallo-endopeptidase [Actinomycetota bacterium]|nr:ImmA/IrrE family metallo-endopeptidase [Actinomycetota bacterium]